MIKNDLLAHPVLFLASEGLVPNFKFFTSVLAAFLQRLFCNPICHLYQEGFLNIQLQSPCSIILGVPTKFSNLSPLIVS